MRSTTIHQFEAIVLKDAVLGGQQRTLVYAWFVVLFAINLVFCIFPGVPYSPQVHWWACVGLIPCAWLTSRKRGYLWGVHGMMLLLWILLMYAATRNGGINTPALIWLAVLPLPALLITELMGVLFWSAAVIAGLTLLYVGNHLMWWPSELPKYNAYKKWLWFNFVSCVLILAFMVWLYERMYHIRKSAFESRNRELRNMHLALKKAQVHKEEFVAVVGHELRTPMNAILGLNGVLREQVNDRLVDVEVVDHIRRSAQQLLSVVNNILDYSQLQAGKLVLAPSTFFLREQIQFVVDGLMDRVNAKSQKLLFHCAKEVPSLLHMDRLRLNQVLGNLLDNATFYTRCI